MYVNSSFPPLLYGTLHPPLIGALKVMNRGYLPVCTMYPLTQYYISRCNTIFTEHIHIPLTKLVKHLVYTRCSFWVLYIPLKKTKDPAFSAAFIPTRKKINDEKGNRNHPFIPRLLTEPLLCYQVLPGTWENLVKHQKWQFLSSRVQMQTVGKIVGLLWAIVRHLVQKK